MNHRHFLLFSLCGLLLLGQCTGIPKNLAPVTSFDLNAYLGTWYEIARLDHRFERGLIQVRATYTRREDGGIDVLNEGYDPEKGRWTSAKGRAYFIDDPSVGRLKVSFFGPFFGAYNILDLDPSYQFALVCGPNHDYLWLLSRTPEVPKTQKEHWMAQAGAFGFATDALIWVPQPQQGLVPAL
jgi:apolipoprotein D and lipocalin family protein